MRYYVGDFETTVFEGQSYTEVWASGLCELYTEEGLIFHSLSETFDYLETIKGNIEIYYHNLKFDGTFWLDYLLKNGFKQACIYFNEEKTALKFKDKKDMLNNEFRYTISSMGLFYSIIIKNKNRFIELRDSFKLLPFSVENIAKSFNLKHRKKEIEYEGFRYAGCKITDAEKEYLLNDLFIPKEALEMLFSKGHNKLTIGACCLSQFKKTFKYEFETFFPRLSEIILPECHKHNTAYDWIRKSYRGGWVYVNETYEGEVIKDGITVDVNSLYPYVMSSSSGYKYPIGKPKFWYGNYIPDEATKDDKYFFIRLRTRFKLKDGYLPFIQIKGNPLYKSTEVLKSSDILINGKYYSEYVNSAGDICQASVVITLTETDYYLFLKHYDLYETEIIDGCFFYCELGLFDEYINYYKDIKMKSKDAERELAKLFSNNLYGKLASSTDSSFKYAYLDEEGIVQYITIPENNKKDVYIAAGAAVTSYGRYETITHAQANYYPNEKKGFMYADTDSLHCRSTIDELKMCKLDNAEYGCWKYEARWDEAIFVRKKTYIERVIEENGKPVEQHYKITCAGMGKRCKQLLAWSLEGKEDYSDEELREEEKEFLSQNRTLEDFKVGLKIPSKLVLKRIPGGIILNYSTFLIR